jgi:hypothetical protein
MRRPRAHWGTTLVVKVLALALLLGAVALLAQPRLVRCTWSGPIEDPAHTFSPEVRAKFDQVRAEIEAADGWCPAP